MTNIVTVLLMTNMLMGVSSNMNTGAEWTMVDAIDTSSLQLQPDNDIIFSAGGKERIKLTPDAFILDGVEIKDAGKAYEGFMAWLKESRNQLLEDK
jgi:hypothetical protein